jgi:hypothetical protein
MGKHLTMNTGQSHTAAKAIAHPKLPSCNEAKEPLNRGAGGSPK